MKKDYMPSLTCPDLSISTLFWAKNGEKFFFKSQKFSRKHHISGYKAQKIIEGVPNMVQNNSGPLMGKKNKIFRRPSKKQFGGCFGGQKCQKMVIFDVKIFFESRNCRENTILGHIKHNRPSKVSQTWCKTILDP